ncbi:MAG: maleylpyruvate isomerase family mycothiol-dependent enzyme [Ilumatobacteraceae bacterium]
MDTSQLIAQVEIDGAALIDTCRRAAPDLPIEACGGWTALDLMWHVAEAHGFFASIIERRATTPDWPDRPDRPAEAVAVAEIARRELERLVTTMRAAPLDAEVWCFGLRPVAVVARRMAHETSVHRYDATSAVGEGWEPTAEMASDGIDEFLALFGRRPRRDAEVVGGSVHLHCTDVDGEWMVRPGADGHEVTREHAKGDCALRGRSADLLLTLWRRRPLSSIEVLGDAAVAARFIAAPRL